MKKFIIIIILIFLGFGGYVAYVELTKDKTPPESAVKIAK